MSLDLHWATTVKVKELVRIKALKVQAVRQKLTSKKLQPVEHYSENK
jgi:hypothetical protein